MKSICLMTWWVPQPPCRMIMEVSLASEQTFQCCLLLCCSKVFGGSKAQEILSWCHCCFLPIILSCLADLVLFSQKKNRKWPRSPRVYEKADRYRKCLMLSIRIDPPEWCEQSTSIVPHSGLCLLVRQKNELKTLHIFRKHILIIFYSCTVLHRCHRDDSAYHQNPEPIRYKDYKPQRYTLLYWVVVRTTQS